MKKSLPSLIISAALCTLGVVSLAPQPASALECSILPPAFCKAADNDLGKNTQATSKNSAVFMILQWALAILSGGVTLAAIVMFVWAGILYSSSGGNAEGVKKAKDIITQTIIGLVMFAALALILTWLIPGGVF